MKRDRRLPAMRPRGDTAWVVVFLEALAGGVSEDEAAWVACVGPARVRRLKEVDPEFVRLCEEARELASIPESYAPPV